MATICFTSSDTFLETDNAACEHAEIEISDYIEGTYSSLRSGPDGKEIALYRHEHGAWELLDGRRFSDWAVEV